MNYSKTIFFILLFLIRVSALGRPYAGFFFVALFIVTVSIRSQHLAIILIQLEVLSLAALVIRGIERACAGKELLVYITVIVMAVVEAAVGLGLLVKLTRYYSKRFLKHSF